MGLYQNTDLGILFTVISVYCNQQQMMLEEGSAQSVFLYF